MRSSSKKNTRKIDKFNLAMLIIKALLVINIIVMIILKIAVIDYSFSIWFYFLIVINIAAIILLFNKNFGKNRKAFLTTTIIYILLMILLPTYKLDGETNVVDESKTRNGTYAGANIVFTYENTVYYTNYYNSYGLKIITFNHNNE